MQFVLRLLRSVLGGGDAVVLRHRASGAVLSAGFPGESDALRFGSAAEAEAFSARFLDEAAGWEAVPASDPTLVLAAA
jgi:hypothetical protein